MTRAEHLAWAKGRALAYLDIGDTSQAVASMVSDMRKHEGSDEVGDETLAEHPGLEPRWVALVAMSGNPREVRNWIEGFN